MIIVYEGPQMSEFLTIDNLDTELIKDTAKL